MRFKIPLQRGTIRKRYKRFLADITLDNGEEITAHVPNTGAMTTCWAEGWIVAVSHHNNHKRKLKYSLEMTHNGKTWIGVNTNLTNRLAHEAIANGIIEELSTFSNIRSEVKVGDSRIDFLLSNDNEKCYVEVKNVTLDSGNDIATFPDAVSTRGQKHLKELIKIKNNGDHAAMLFIVQREDVTSFAPAMDIDPEYARLLKEAKDAGVKILVYQCSLNDNEIVVKRKLSAKV